MSEDERRLDEARRAFRFHGGVEPEVLQSEAWYYKATVRLLEHKLLRNDPFGGDHEKREREPEEAIPMLMWMYAGMMDRGWKVGQILYVLTTAAAETAVELVIPRSVLVQGTMALYDRRVDDIDAYIKEHESTMKYAEWRDGLRTKMYEYVDLDDYDEP